MLAACTPEDGRETGSGSGIGGLTSDAASSGGIPPLGTTSGGAGSSGGSGMVDGTTGEGIRFDLGDEGSGSLPPVGECQTDLIATVRDFMSSHPDFEGLVAVDPGIVEPMLGGDGKPVYAGGTTGTTSGAANFDQWYRDVAGVNITIPTEIPLTDQGDGTYVFDSAAFFPIDDQGHGNEGNAHNYHFTLEMHTQFTYQGGEVFTFRGDDDLFTFINGRLGIDLGGVHGPMEGSIDLDAMAGALEITPGGTYDLDFFFAERHTTQSNFRIETTIGCFQPPG